MTRFFFLALVSLAVAAVAIGDVFLKKAALTGNLQAAFLSPWFWGAAALYLFQVVIFTYVFTSGWELSIVGIMQTALYALIVLSAGFLIFGESFTPLQIGGAALALTGVVILNI